MEDQDLSAPLVEPEPQLILTVHDDDDQRPFSNQGPENQDNQLGHPHFENLDGPFEFLGSSSGFDVPGSTTLDPFRNHTLEIEGVYEWVKIVICLPIALLRLVLFAICMMIGFVATKLALFGWKDKDNPMPKWRCRLMWVTRLVTRGILFSFGYHWIKRKGKPAPREIAPIIVSNHVSYIDPIFYFYEFFPTIVASDSHDSMPFVGTIIRAMQVIYVNRFTPSSRKHAISEIKRKAGCNRFPRVLLFPEGTTTNGRSLISFQLGAFIPGYAIQPVVVRYPHVHFDQSWGNISLAKLMFRMMTQFHNFMEIEFLPVVPPLENQKENAVRFAEKTAHAMCRALNVVQTSHAFGDVMLLAKALESKKENPSLYMVEMASVETLYHISSFEAVQFLEIFLSMNPDNSGHIGMNDFLRVMRLKHCCLSEKIFRFLDVKSTGRITFKQFLVGSSHILKQPLFRRACEVAFTICDANANRYITQQELGDAILPAIPDINEDETLEVFKLFDKDNDGKISKDDFMTCLRRNPLLISLFSRQLSQIDLTSEVADKSIEEMV